MIAVKPGSDAEAKGLKVGDRVLSLNGVVPSRSTFWEILYVFRTLRPQTTDELIVRSPEGIERTLSVAPKIEQAQDRLTFDIEELLRTMDTHEERQLLQPRPYDIGKSVTICKLNTFSQDDTGIDKIMEHASKFPSLVLDLRGNTGGSEVTLLRLLGALLDHDIKVWDRTDRKGTHEIVAKSRGKRAYRGKLVVLVDAQSAAASEVFARSIQLQQRGVVLGDDTSGRVCAKQSFHFHDSGLQMGHYNLGYVVVITEADILMPDGKSLERTGVIPYTRMLPTAHDLESNRDPVLSYGVALAGGELSPEEAGKLFPTLWRK